MLKILMLKFLFLRLDLTMLIWKMYTWREGKLLFLPVACAHAYCWPKMEQEFR